jgi:putative RecB family exonuclease
VLGEFYQARMTGDRMPLSFIQKLFEENWKAVAELNDEIRYSKGKDFEILLTEGIDLLTAWYHKLPDDNFRVLSVEEAFSFNIEDLPFPLSGQQISLKRMSPGPSS